MGIIEWYRGWREERRVKAEQREQDERKKKACEKHGFDVQCGGCRLWMHEHECGKCVFGTNSFWFYECNCGHITAMHLYGPFPLVVQEGTGMMVEAMAVYSEWRKPKPSNTLVIYHGNCADGFTAAWAVRKKFPDAEFYPGVYSKPPPDVTGKDVIFVDFCYKRPVMGELSFKARSILVLDHHKGAAEDMYNEERTGTEFVPVIRMDGRETKYGWDDVTTLVAMDANENIGRALIYAYFDMNRSGAGIAWDFFHPDEPRPTLVDYVEDRDLWRFIMEGTREVNATVFSYEYTFENWDMLSCWTLDRFLADGVPIERRHHKDIAELTVLLKRRMVIGGHDVPVSSLPYTQVSDAAGLMAVGELFAACYWDTPTNRIFGLRSSPEGIDVCKVAEQYGGGGHFHSAGFSVPRDHELAKS